MNSQAYSILQISPCVKKRVNLVLVYYGMTVIPLDKTKIITKNKQNKTSYFVNLLYIYKLNIMKKL